MDQSEPLVNKIKDAKSQFQNINEIYSGSQVDKIQQQRYNRTSMIRMNATADSNAEGEERVKNPFGKYSYLVLGLIFLMRLCDQQ